MPWFRLEDSFHSHPKVLKAGNEAIGLYVRCGTYAAQHLTDGFIPEHIAHLYGALDVRRGSDETLAETLVKAKLWRRTRGGWRMPDYLDFNPSKEAVEKDRETRAERQRRWREKQRRRVTDTSRNGSGDGAPARPAPPRPEGGGGGAPPEPAPERANPSGSPGSDTPTHPFHDDGFGTCRTCQLPQSNRTHQDAA